jgi:hypothetical protein
MYMQQNFKKKCFDIDSEEGKGMRAECESSLGGKRIISSVNSRSEEGRSCQRDSKGVHDRSSFYLFKGIGSPDKFFCEGLAKIKQYTCAIGFWTLVCLLEKKINIKLLHVSLKHLLNIKIVPKAVSDFCSCFPCLRVYSWPAFRTIIRITGGFILFFLERWLLEGLFSL